MKKDYWRQVRDFAEKCDLELLAVSALKNQLDVEIAKLALKEIDSALIATGDNYGTTYQPDYDIMVSARRNAKNSAENVRTNWRKEIDTMP